jgi:predicted RNA binding protein YcfA (HicA-like mRNA interferase family)
VGSKQLIKELKNAGYELVSIRGSHHKFRHAGMNITVVVPHPRKDLGKGLEKAIRQQAKL